MLDPNGQVDIRKGDANESMVHRGMALRLSVAAIG